MSETDKQGADRPDSALRRAMKAKATAEPADPSGSALHRAMRGKAQDGAADEVPDERGTAPVND